MSRHGVRHADSNRCPKCGGAEFRDDFHEHRRGGPYVRLAQTLAGHENMDRLPDEWISRRCKNCDFVLRVAPRDGESWKPEENGWLPAGEAEPEEPEERRTVWFGTEWVPEPGRSLAVVVPVGLPLHFTEAEIREAGMRPGAIEGEIGFSKSVLLLSAARKRGDPNADRILAAWQMRPEELPL